MDNKPLLQDRPPAYNSVPGAYNFQQPQPGYGAIPQPGYGAIPQPGYGAIPQPAPASAAFPSPPPPYPFPAAQGQPAAPGQAAATGTPANCPGTYTIIQPSVVVVGGCPACRVGVLEDDFTCLGIMCAIVFFPLGILFCLALRQRRCPNCGATFG